MNAAKAININNFLQIRMLGLDALKNALGVVGATRFLQQYDAGCGDYTKEKYSIPEEDEQAVYEQLKNY
ncbi:MAG: hypothetical protein IK015_10080 [Treponema sp.]|nr:hypothetical protein [Treponema sp.]